MANQVKIIFTAEESALLRAQKRVVAGEKEAAAAMKETAKAAEQAERRVLGAKQRAAKPVSTGWIPGSHGVSPAVLSTTVQRDRRETMARINASLRGSGGRGGALTGAAIGADPMLIAADAQIRDEFRRRALLGARESRMLASARFAGVDTADFDAVQFSRFRRANELRAERTLASGRRTGAIVREAHGALMAEKSERDARIKDAQFAAFGAKADAMRWHQENRRQLRESIATGAMAVGAAVGGIAAMAGEELNRHANVIVEAERSMATVYGVGANPARRTAIRGEILSGSISSGLTLGNIAELRGRMESAFEDMPDDARRAAERAAIQYARVGVTDSTQTALGLGAAYQFYGRDLGGGARAMNTLANRLAHAADVGAFDPNQVTPYLADVLGTFSALEYSDSEAFAALATASKSGMRAEKFSTALRNIPLTLTDAASRGQFQRTGSFSGDMQALSTKTDAELLKIVGRDAFPVVALMKTQMAQLQAYTAQMRLLGPDSGVLSRKIGVGLANDRMAMTASTIMSAQQLQANAPLIQMEDPLLGKAVEEWSLRTAGAAREIHPMFSWFAKPAAWMETAGQLTGNYSPLRDAGVRELINARRKEGENFTADYLSLRYNPDRDMHYTGKDGRRIMAGEEQAEQLRSFYKQGYTDLSAGELMQYLQIQSAGGDATGFLDAKGRPKAGTAKSAPTPVDAFGAAVDKFVAAVDRADSGGYLDAQRR